MITPDYINNILAFLRSAEKLKDTLQTAHTGSGRQKSTAEYSWRLSLLAMLLAEQYEGIDPLKLFKMCIVHDLGEANSGDIAAVEQVDSAEKSAQERQDLLILITPLPDSLKNEIFALWEEYERAESSEAKLAKAMDKIETLLQLLKVRTLPTLIMALTSLTDVNTRMPPLTAMLRREIDKDTKNLI